MTADSLSMLDYVAADLIAHADVRCTSTKKFAGYANSNEILYRHRSLGKAIADERVCKDKYFICIDRLISQHLTKVMIWSSICEDIRES